MKIQQQKRLAKGMAPWLNRLGVPLLTRPVFGGLGHILMFHRVVPDHGEERVENHESLEVTVDHLTDIVHYFRSRGYTFVDLDEIHARLQSGKFGKPFVHFTFDDGYRDNLEHAYPVLKARAVPFTIYVTTSFPDRTAVVWWYLLEKLVAGRNHIAFTLENVKHEIRAGSPREKESAFATLRSLLIGLEGNALTDRLEAVAGPGPIGNQELMDKLALTWDDIRELNQDPLVTIGAHTLSHPALSQIPVDDAKTEIQRSRERIADQIGGPVDHFAYPFGGRGEAGLREFELVKTLGFKTATTTRLGNIFDGHANHLTCLPRLSINALTTPAVLRLQTSGFFSALRFRLRRVVTC